jgi:hypothetical protein
MKYAVALITCLAVQSLPANALSGSELYQYCMEKKPSTGDAMCLAYVRGFIDGITMGLWWVKTTRQNTVRRKRESLSIRGV